MKEKRVLPIVAALVTVALGLGVLAGGCRERKAASTSEACPSSVPLPEVGLRADSIGRLDETIEAHATLFHAGGATTDSTRVRIVEGTWLVPPPVIAGPEPTE